MPRGIVREKRIVGKTAVPRRCLKQNHEKREKNWKRNGSVNAMNKYIHLQKTHNGKHVFPQTVLALGVLIFLVYRIGFPFQDLPSPA